MFVHTSHTYEGHPFDASFYISFHIGQKNDIHLHRSRNRSNIQKRRSGEICGARSAKLFTISFAILRKLHRHFTGNFTTKSTNFLHFHPNEFLVAETRVKARWRLQSFDAQAGFQRFKLDWERIPD